MSLAQNRYIAAAEESPVVTEPDPVLAATLAFVRESALAENLAYAGSVPPDLAWELFSTGQAQLVDVRTAEERKFVGHVPGTLHVPWVTGTSLIRNPRFTRELEAKVSKDKPVLLICRSGKRSADAAEAATKAGLKQIYNVLEGFEGDLDATQHRGTLNGWRHHGLPWVQD